MTSSELRDSIQKIIDNGDLIYGVAAYCSGGQCWLRVPAGIFTDSGPHGKPILQPVRFNMTGAQISEVAMQLAEYTKAAQSVMMYKYEARQVM